MERWGRQHHSFIDIQNCEHMQRLACVIVPSLFTQERKITHLQYIDWPDHGIPDNPQPFLSEYQFLLYVYVASSRVVHVWVLFVIFSTPPPPPLSLLPRLSSRSEVPPSNRLKSSCLGPLQCRCWKVRGRCISGYAHGKSRLGRGVCVCACA